MFIVIVKRAKSSYLLMLILACIIVLSTSFFMVPRSISEPNSLSTPFRVMISEARESPIEDAKNPSQKSAHSDHPQQDEIYETSRDGFQIISSSYDNQEQPEKPKKRSITSSDSHITKQPLDEGKMALLLSQWFRLRNATNCTEEYKRAAVCDKNAKGTNGASCDTQNQQTSEADGQRDERPDLPRPTQIIVQIQSWYPPILELKWTFDELGGNERDLLKLDFYEESGNSSKESRSQKTEFDFDLDLAIKNHDYQLENGRSNKSETTNRENRYLRDLKIRRFLVRKSLSCFQVVYNSVNSR